MNTLIIHKTRCLSPCLLLVRNNKTGDIVQVSDTNDPDWKAPWDDDNDNNGDNDNSNNNNTSSKKYDGRLGKDLYLMDDCNVYTKDIFGNFHRNFEYDENGEKLSDFEKLYLYPYGGNSVPGLNPVNPPTTMPNINIKIPIPTWIPVFP